MKLSLCITILLGLALNTNAQVERKPLPAKADTLAMQSPGSGKTKLNQNRKDRLQALDLTKEQRGKLKEIRQSGQAAKEAIENNAALSEADKKRKLREMQKDLAQEIQAILTPEQLEKYKASRQNHP